MSLKHSVLKLILIKKNCSIVKWIYESLYKAVTNTDIIIYFPASSAVIIKVEKYILLNLMILTCSIQHSTSREYVTF